MPQPKEFAHDRFMRKHDISYTDLPEDLQLEVKVHRDRTNRDGYTTELYEESDTIAAEIEEWYLDEIELAEELPVPAVVPVTAASNPAPTAAAVPPVAAVPPGKPKVNPSADAELLERLFNEGTRRITHAQLKTAGFTSDPGMFGMKIGSYELSRSLMEVSFTLKKK